MAKVLKAQEIEAEVEEDSGYFYQRLGELSFTPESDSSSHGSQKGYEQRLAVASRHGVAVFADHRGDIPHSVKSYRLLFVDSHCHCHCMSYVLSFYHFFLFSVSDGSNVDSISCILDAVFATWFFIIYLSIRYRNITPLSFFCRSVYRQGAQSPWSSHEG